MADDGFRLACVFHGCLPPNPEERDPRCARSTDEIAKALTGHYRPEHVFALKQALALYDSYTVQVHECDTEIAQHFQAIKPVGVNEPPPLDRTASRPSHSKNAPTYDAHSFLCQLTGVDLLTIPGLQASTAQIILAEIGLDMDRWPNEKAFCAWLGWAPRHEISGGKVLRRHTLKTHNRAARRFASPPKRRGETRVAWAPFTGGCGCGLVRPRPWWPLPTKSHASCITCSSTARRFASRVPRNIPDGPGPGRARPCAAARFGLTLMEGQA